MDHTETATTVTASNNDLLFDFPSNTDSDFVSGKMVMAQTNMAAVQSAMDAALDLPKAMPTKKSDTDYYNVNQREDSDPRNSQRDTTGVELSNLLGSIANKKEKLNLEVKQPPRRVTASVKETGMDSVRNYMKTMCNHELLNKNEEIILAREIQVLVLWEKKREELEAELLRYVDYCYLCGYCETNQP
jgi:hypothetical protein